MNEIIGTVPPLAPDNSSLSEKLLTDDGTARILTQPIPEEVAEVVTRRIEEQHGIIREDD